MRTIVRFGPGLATGDKFPACVTVKFWPPAAEPYPFPTGSPAGAWRNSPKTSGDEVLAKDWGNSEFKRTPKLRVFGAA